MSKKEQPPLPGIDIKPLLWSVVRIHSADCVTVEFKPYILTRPLTSEEAAKLHRESQLPALKEAQEILSREIEKIETGG